MLIFNQFSYRQTNIIISTKANQDQLREGGRYRGDRLGWWVTTKMLEVDRVEGRL